MDNLDFKASLKSVDIFMPQLPEKGSSGNRGRFDSSDYHLGTLEYAKQADHGKCSVTNQDVKSVLALEFFLIGKNVPSKGCKMLSEQQAFHKP